MHLVQTSMQALYLNLAIPANICHWLTALKPGVKAVPFLPWQLPDATNSKLFCL